MDMLQAPHTWSGIEMALWDLIGKARSAPVWSLLGYKKAHKKMPYASVLCGDTPEETRALGKAAREKGFRAAKFGWGPIGRGTLKDDEDQFAAAREGVGKDGILLIDAGQIWGEDVDAAAARLSSLEAQNALWLEEPFQGYAYEAYAALAKRSPRVKLAGGEAAHNYHMARHTIDFGHVGFVQIDCGRIGGIGPAKAVADHAVARGITYVNHTFTSHLALSASIQPFAGLEAHRICEYPMEPKQLALDIAKNPLVPDANGELVLHEGPGLGIAVNTTGIRKYLVDVEISAKGKRLYTTPKL
jgi:L-alanine-DL-glutamate epimerase-like enolase superfamily enzyme